MAANSNVRETNTVTDLSPYQLVSMMLMIWGALLYFALPSYFLSLSLMSQCVLMCEQPTRDYLLPLKAVFRAVFSHVTGLLNGMRFCLQTSLKHVNSFCMLTIQMKKN